MIYERLGISPIVNAKGTATRLSGGIMRPEVAEAMAEASQHCVDMTELQANGTKISSCWWKPRARRLVGQPRQGLTKATWY